MADNWLQALLGGGFRAVPPGGLLGNMGDDGGYQSFMNGLNNNRNMIAGLGLGLLSGTKYNPYGNVMQGFSQGAGADALNNYRNAMLARQAENDVYQRKQDAISNSFRERALANSETPEGIRLLKSIGVDPMSPEGKGYLLRGQEPEKVRMVRAAGIDPASPEGRQALFKLDEKLGAADKKAIYEAEDENAQLDTTVSALKRAKELNPDIYTGYGAQARTWLGTKLPDAVVPDAVADPKKAQKSEEWSRIMAPEALKTMAATLKGATTDFELRKFIEMLADPTTTPETRASIIDRLQTLAERKRGVNKTRMDQLRGGSYYRPGGGQSAPERSGTTGSGIKWTVE